MAIAIKDIIVLAIGFVLIVILTPIGMQVIGGQNTTFGLSNGTLGNTSYNTWLSNAAVSYTLFAVLIPVLYIIGAALYLMPKLRED